MYLRSTSISCGAFEVSDLWNRHKDGGLRAFFKTVKSNWAGPAAFILFSDTEERGHGRRLAEALNKRYPRSCRASQVRVNPNSGNRIRVWTWAVPDDFYLKETKKRRRRGA